MPSKRIRDYNKYASSHKEFANRQCTSCVSYLKSGVQEQEIHIPFVHKRIWKTAIIVNGKPNVSMSRTGFRKGWTWSSFSPNTWHATNADYDTVEKYVEVAESTLRQAEREKGVHRGRDVSSVGPESRHHKVHGPTTRAMDAALDLEKETRMADRSTRRWETIESREWSGIHFKSAARQWSG